LIVALTTLVLPWAGCQYGRELETALRGSQEKSLLASAGTIANALSAQPQRVFSDDDDGAPFAAGRGDLYVYPLTNQPALDGYREDWGPEPALSLLPSTSGLRARLLAGCTERYVYLYAEVDDAHFVAEPRDLHGDQGPFTRVTLWLQGPDGATSRYFFATDAPGLSAAQRVVNAADGVDRIAPESRIVGFWLQSAAGYHLEVRIPRSFVGRHLWMQAWSGDGTHAGVAPLESPAPGSDPGESRDEGSKAGAGGRLFFPTKGLNDLLATFVRDGTRVTVIDANALKLGTASTVVAGAATSRAGPSWYRRFLEVDTSKLPVLSDAPDTLVGDSVLAALGGLPGAEWVAGSGDSGLLLTASAPIIVNDRTRGAVVLEQAADHLISARDHALTRLFTLTFIATASTVIIMFAFATWLSLRIGRLRTAADAAVGNDGTINLRMPESAAADEIGALARGFERLLTRLNEHTQYLRTLGGKLSHELRTPLTIVRSSLDNLESEGLRDDQLRYITRARDGTQRLQSILSALGAAARVEESIKQAERVNFDLRDLLSTTVAAYRDGFPAVDLRLRLPDDACFLRGAPDLIVQMLDKLIENAVDFCSTPGCIDVRLERAAGCYFLSVGNDGPAIAPETLAHLFESLVGQRAGRDDKPHFGLGLYIVRLVAEFHGGKAVAGNRAGGGAVFTVTLPML
jgi:dedicated sortase system histidine kinase